MTHYFPETEPRDSGMLDVSALHTIYWQRCGAASGHPLLFLHGGPGSGIAPRHRRMFDPDLFDTVLFDQRGCGRSRPHLSLEDNTTQHLIGDIEMLREHLGIERWIVFGPSWGSTLAIAYAEAHPDRVAALIPEGIFLGTEEELQWMHHTSQVPRIFPDARADFVSEVPASYRDSVPLLLEWCFEAMKQEIADGCPDLEKLSAQSTPLEDLRRSTLYRWTEYEERLSYLEIAPDAVHASLRAKGADFVAAHSLIELHYFNHGCFLRNDQLIREARRLANIPMHIVHSRYDMVCPAESAFRLAHACPHAQLHLVPVNGHAMTETTQAVLNTIMSGIAGDMRKTAPVETEGHAAATPPAPAAKAHARRDAPGRR